MACEEKDTMETITNAEATSEAPLSFDEPQYEGDTKLSVMIVHEGGSEEVSGFTYIEEKDIFNGTTLRVWYGEPFESSDYVDYDHATITEVSP